MPSTTTTTHEAMTIVVIQSRPLKVFLVAIKLSDGKCNNVEKKKRFSEIGVVDHFQDDNYSVDIITELEWNGREGRVCIKIIFMTDEIKEPTSQKWNMSNSEFIF